MTGSFYVSQAPETVYSNANIRWCTARSYGSFCFVSTEKSSALRLGLCGHCVWQMGCSMLLLNSCRRTGNLAVCLSISLFICACVHMRVDMQAREQPHLLSSGAPFSSFETVSYWPRAPCSGEASWPARPRNLPATAFHSADGCHLVQHFCMVVRDHSSPWC